MMSHLTSMRCLDWPISKPTFWDPDDTKAQGLMGCPVTCTEFLHRLLPDFYGLSWPRWPLDVPSPCDGKGEKFAPYQRPMHQAMQSKSTDPYCWLTMHPSSHMVLCARNSCLSFRSFASQCKPEECHALALTCSACMYRHTRSTPEAAAFPVPHFLWISGKPFIAFADHLLRSRLFMNPSWLISLHPTAGALSFFKTSWLRFVRPLHCTEPISRLTWKPKWPRPCKPHGFKWKDNRPHWLPLELAPDPETP